MSSAHSSCLQHLGSSPFISLFVDRETTRGLCESSSLEAIVYPYKEAVEFYSPAVKNRSSHLQHHLHHHSQQRPKKSQAKAPEYYMSWSIQVQPADIKY
jgi:hypothetical protein